MEAAEAAEKLQPALRVITAFLASMEEYRARSIRSVPSNPWRYAASSVCGHLDIFRQRLLDLQAIAGTAAQYGRLDRIEIGGSQVGLDVREPSAELGQPLKRATLGRAGQGADAEAAHDPRGGRRRARRRAGAGLRPAGHGRDGLRG